MSRYTRKKAMDVFNDSNFPFAKKVTFNEAFPEIEEIDAEVIEKEMGSGSEPINTHKYNNNNLPGEYVNCSNPICYNGGLSIGRIIRHMVQDRKTIEEDSAICKGNEGSPKGRRIYRKCLHLFTYKITIVYKNEPSKAV